MGATVKHFVCNDVETKRTKVNVVIQERWETQYTLHHPNLYSSDNFSRPLREIYLKPFQIVVRDSKPWAVMASYNKVNGQHVSESRGLLEGVIRKEWGWDGVIM